MALKKPVHFAWKYIVFISISSSVFISDFATKAYILSHYQWAQSTVVIPHFFSITYVRNRGAAFGFLNSLDPKWREPFFNSVPFLILTVLAYLFLIAERTEKLKMVAYSLIISGALGNIVDRLNHGFVVDFLDFYISHYHWPAFNVADSAIVVGVGCLFLLSYQESKKENKT